MLHSRARMWRPPFALRTRATPSVASPDLPRPVFVINRTIRPSLLAEPAMADDHPCSCLLSLFP